MQTTHPATQWRKAMGTTTIRIDRTTQATLRDLSRQTGKSMQALLAEAIEAYRREHFFDQLDTDYAALQADPAAWEEELAERRAWDATLNDGMEEG
jgi:predicted transcriptional regulator